MDMRLSRDRCGLESFPLRLMIVAVVAALSVAPAAEALETMRDRDFVARASVLLDRLVGTAQVLALEGAGAVRTLELDFSSQGSLRLVRLLVGDEPGGRCTNAVRLELSSGACIVRAAHDPWVAMTSATMSALSISSEKATVRLEAGFSDGMRAVTVGVV